MVALVTTIHSYAGILSVLGEILKPVALILAIMCMVKYLR